MVSFPSFGFSFWGLKSRRLSLWGLKSCRPLYSDNVFHPCYIIIQ
ncbi:unnamed protein product, partial [Arabidopsis halleri]